jgi:hypothetical protein
MRWSNVSEPRSPNLHIFVVAATIVAMIARVGNSQEPAHGPMDHVPGWNKRAHIHNIDMSCCAPCAPETNQDADVFKRPCFTRDLLKSRKGFDAYFGLSDAEEARVSQEGIPGEGIAGFEALLTSLLQPGFLPTEWNRANFHVPYPIKSVMEVRGGITTYVGHAVDRTAVAASEVTSSDPIQGAWTVGGIEVLPRTPNMVDRPTRATIRLRLRGDDRLAFQMRPPDLDPDDPRQYDFAWEYFDRASVQQLLTKVFRVPFAKPEDVAVRGSRGEYKGVAALDGQIISHEWAQAGGSLNAGSPTPHWWDKMRLLVTDSDPQYFCVEIILGRDDAIPVAQP